MFGRKMQWIAGVALILGLSGLRAASAADDAHAGHKHGHEGHSHGHHLCESEIDMPKDYASAVVRIKKCRTVIAEQITKGQLDAVHGPLDEATIILGKIMPLARDSGVPKAKWQDVNLAARDLKKRFEALHTSIDKSGKADFKPVAKPIDQAIARLEAAAPTTAQRALPPTR